MIAQKTKSTSHERATEVNQNHVNEKRGAIKPLTFLHDYVWESPWLPAERALLTIITLRADNLSHETPAGLTYDIIGEKMGVTSRQAKRVVKSLRAKGAINKMAERLPGSPKNEPNRYRLNVAAIVAAVKSVSLREQGDIYDNHQGDILAHQGDKQGDKQGDIEVSRMSPTSLSSLSSNQNNKSNNREVLSLSSGEAEGGAEAEAIEGGEVAGRVRAILDEEGLGHIIGPIFLRSVVKDVTSGAIAPTEALSLAALKEGCAALAKKADGKPVEWLCGKVVPYAKGAPCLKPESSPNPESKRGGSSRRYGTLQAGGFTPAVAVDLTGPETPEEARKRGARPSDRFLDDLEGNVRLHEWAVENGVIAKGAVFDDTAEALARAYYDHAHPTFDGEPARTSPEELRRIMDEAAKMGTLTADGVPIPRPQRPVRRDARGRVYSPAMPLPDPVYYPPRPAFLGVNNEENKARIMAEWESKQTPATLAYYAAKDAEHAAAEAEKLAKQEEHAREDALRARKAKEHNDWAAVHYPQGLAALDDETQPRALVPPPTAPVQGPMSLNTSNDMSIGEQMIAARRASFASPSRAPVTASPPVEPRYVPRPARAPGTPPLKFAELAPPAATAPYDDDELIPF